MASLGYNAFRITVHGFVRFHIYNGYLLNIDLYFNVSVWLWTTYTYGFGIKEYVPSVIFHQQKVMCHVRQDGGNSCCFNSLAPGKFEWNFRHVIFKKILVIYACDISCEIALIWMSLDFTDDQSTLVQVMAWCRQATSHYLSQCWPRSLLPYDITWPQWVKSCLCGLFFIMFYGLIFYGLYLTPMMK